MRRRDKRPLVVRDFYGPYWSVYWPKIGLVGVKISWQDAVRLAMSYWGETRRDR